MQGRAVLLMYMCSVEFSFPFCKNTKILHFSGQINMGLYGKCLEIGESLVRIQILLGWLEEPGGAKTGGDKNFTMHSPEPSCRKKSFGHRFPVSCRPLLTVVE